MSCDTIRPMRPISAIGAGFAVLLLVACTPTLSSSEYVKCQERVQADLAEDDTSDTTLADYRDLLLRECGEEPATDTK